MSMHRRTALGCLGASVAAPLSVLAQSDYPSRPIRFIIPSVPGGATDILGRIVAAGLAERLPQPVVPDNRPGAGTSLGAEFVAKSLPDGYTLLACGIASHAINPAVYKNIGYDPNKSFTPISLVATLPNVLLAHPGFPVANIKELIALLKANPGKYSYSSVGNGTSPHLSAEMFLQAAGVTAQHVPYKGSAPALVDLMSGMVPFGFDNVSGALPLVASGKLKALGVTTRQRTSMMPNVPSISEFVDGYEVASWAGLCAPAGLPAPILQRLSTATMALLRDPTTIKKIANAGATAAPMSPQEFGDFVASQSAKFRAVAHRANLQLG